MLGFLVCIFFFFCIGRTCAIDTRTRGESGGQGKRRGQRAKRGQTTAMTTEESEEEHCTTPLRLLAAKAAGHVASVLCLQWGQRDLDGKQKHASRTLDFSNTTRQQRKSSRRDSRYVPDNLELGISDLGCGAKESRRNSMMMKLWSDVYNRLG